MAIWIHKYNSDPNIKSKIDLFTYSTTASVYPSYVSGVISGLNPNVFTNFEKITKSDGTELDVKVDFSGVHVGHRKLGDGGEVHCQQPSIAEGFYTCQNLGWPYCNAAWTYSLPNNQFFCSTDAIQDVESYCAPLNACLFDTTYSNNYAQDGSLKQPLRLIDPRIHGNEKYWNDLNLWHNGFWLGNVLIQHDGPEYGTPGGYEYFISVGHPITSSPCAGPISFFFFDHITNQYISREFICPCVAFESSTPNNYYQCANNNENDNFGIDNPRLWIMKEGQEPIPSYIKRYKVLKGKNRINWPVYGFHNNHRISKTITYLTQNGNFSTKIDRNIPGSYGFNHIPNYLESYFSYSGQGEDGGSIFTLTDDGETIFIRLQDNDHGSISLNNMMPPLVGDGKCNGPDDMFKKVGDHIEFNEYCLPHVYKPEEIYESTLPDIDSGPSGTVGIGSSYNPIVKLNNRLQQLGKPKIVTYSFPEYATSSDVGNLNNIENINDKYPLKNSPYLSRESLNDFFQNCNYILFEEKRMLQASELNELQEKFYKNQSLMIEHCRNWLKKSNLTSTNKDILCTSTTSPVYDYHVATSKIFPKNKNSLQINEATAPTLLTHFIMKPDWYLLNSNFEQAEYNEYGIFNALPNSTFSEINFVKLNETKTIEFDTSNIQENHIKMILVDIDMSNIIDCYQYEELKDNSGGSSENSPCGAKRNNLYIKNIRSMDWELTEPPTNHLDPSTLPFNSWSTALSGVPHLLAYAKKENGVVNFYYGNGLRF